jgi:uncharacterized delta-60 repeat protein
MIILMDRRSLGLGLSLAVGGLLILITVLVAQAGTSEIETSSSLDASFGNNGIVVTDLGGEDESANDLAVQSDGKIVIVGTVSNRDAFGVYRYQTDGSLDSSFGSGGVVTTVVGAGQCEASGVALQPDGKIVVVGTGGTWGDSSLTVARYDVGGALDTSFGDGGIVTLTVGSEYNWGSDVVIQSDGKILVSGSSVLATYDFVLARYDTHGNLDAGFGGTGVITTDLTGDEDFANALALQPDGKIVVVGRGDTGDYDFAVARYETDGDLDPAFGSGGITVTHVSGASDDVYDVVVQPDGKIVVVGTAGYADLAIVRYNADGSLDTTFSGDGIDTIDVYGSGDVGEAVALLPGGKIVVAGYTYSGTEDILVVCYNAGGSLDDTFDGDGIATLDIAGGDDAVRAVGVDGLNRIVVAGVYSDGDDDDIALARYLGDTRRVFLPLVLRGVSSQ